MAQDQHVLVTGASGFLAQHIIFLLLERGYRVRGTVRSFDKADPLREALRQITPMADMMELVEADLSTDEGWREACEGCDAIMHTASPFPVKLPKNAEELIIPARDGALRVLKAAKAAGSTRVVMTSSMAAIAYGWGAERPSPLNETHWSNPDNLKDNTAYTRSKTIAERAAWNFVESPDGEGLELVVINPGLILGPTLSADTSPSLEIITQMLSGRLPALLDLNFSVIDVRDVAEAHLRALSTEEAAGERFLLCESVISMAEIADVLKSAFPDFADKVPVRVLPNWLVKLLAMVRPDLRQMLPELGKAREIDNQKFRNTFGIQPETAATAVTEAARSLIHFNKV